MIFSSVLVTDSLFPRQSVAVFSVPSFSASFQIVQQKISTLVGCKSPSAASSSAAADAKYYGNIEVYNILKARGAKKNRKTPMIVANPREVPEYELNPLELQGSYQVAKWNGTKVTVKILDKDSYSDPETM
ncbi:hypothetical protein ACFE04_015771 [Oxalis oulophora]